MQDTKERILDAAEKLFAERGYDAASLRAITSAAGVNLAAVNYHFSSKEALVRAVFARKLTPVNQKRLALLDALEAGAGRNPVAVDRLVRALVDPVVRLLEQPGGGMSFGTLLGRMYSNPGKAVREIFYSEIKDVVRRFQAAFRRSLPELTPEEVFWRIFFGIGAMSHILAAGWMVPLVSNGSADVSDIDGMSDRLTAYMTAGMKGPLPVRRTAGPHASRAARSRSAGVKSGRRTSSGNLW